MSGPPQQLACPACGAPAIPTAVLCTSCGYNFRTGLKTVGFGRRAPNRGTKQTSPSGGGGPSARPRTGSPSIWFAPTGVFTSKVGMPVSWQMAPSQSAA